MSEHHGPRLLTVPQFAEELATSPAQIIALLKRGELLGLQIGGRGHWRIERGQRGEDIVPGYVETEPSDEEPTGRRPSAMPRRSSLSRRSQRSLSSRLAIGTRCSICRSNAEPSRRPDRS